MDREVRAASGHCKKRSKDGYKNDTKPKDHQERHKVWESPRQYRNVIHIINRAVKQRWDQNKDQVPTTPGPNLREGNQRDSIDITLLNSHKNKKH